MSTIKKALLVLIIVSAFALTGCTLGPAEEKQETPQAQELEQGSAGPEQESSSTEAETGPEATEDNSSPVDVGNSTESVLEEIPFPIQ